MKHEFRIIVSAVSKGLGDIRKLSTEVAAGSRKMSLANRAFSETLRGGRREASLFGGQLKTLLGAFLGLTAIGRTTAIIEQSDQAIFNLKASVAAANREFDNVGSVEQWEQTVKRLSDEMVIYSETALKNAVSRTVDMTKRLGLSADQMEEVIRRAANLGAGKVELEGAIERVTAALRGEAESAEYLGLTLNENYIKAWYEANRATEKAWKDLTDIEKAQARYQVMLEQSNEMQGRAAASANTFGGAIQLVRKEIEDAVVNNKAVVATLTDLAKVLRDNSGEIGAFVARLLTWTARTVELAVKYKELLLVIAGGALATAAIGRLVTLVKALNAAFAVLTGMGLVKWLADVRLAMSGVAASGGLAATALKAGVAAAAAWGVVQIGRLIKAVYEWRQAAQVAEESQRRMIAVSDRAIKSLARFKDTRLPDDLTGTAATDLQQLQWELTRASQYYQVLINKMQATGQTAELEKARARLREIRGDLARLGEDAGTALEKPAEAVKATAAQLDHFEQKAKAAYKAARDEAQKYAEKIEAINRRIAERGLDTEDKIRELKRRNLSEEEAAADLRLEAIEKVRAANEELARYQADDNAQARDNAKRFFDDAARLWEQYAAQGEKATSEAISGLEDIRKGLDQLDQTEIGWIQRMKTQAEEMAAEIEQQLEQLTRDRNTNVDIELRRLEQAQAAINELTRDETKHIYVTVHERTVQENAQGGFIGGFPRRSGKLPGFGGGDRIRSLLEAGEYIIRKEAVQKYGAGLFHALNGMRLALPDLNGLVRARLGGLVGSIRLPAYAAGGMANPTETMVVELRAGSASLPLTVAGGNRMNRQAVREFEKELRKMRLSHR